MMFSTRANSDKDEGARALTRRGLTRWDKIPNSPAVRVIASSTVTPTNSASSTITIAVPGDTH